MSADPCPCGSSRRRESCCGPFLDGPADPPTAEALMRARYTAYVECQLDFLQQTLVPRDRVSFDRQGARRFSRGVRWQGLTILRTTGGGAGASRGSVTFEARFSTKGRDDGFRERSLFVRQDGRWLYAGGETSPLGAAPVRRPGKKVGRNEPCPCGSGRKFKRCCG